MSDTFLYQAKRGYCKTSAKSRSITLPFRHAFPILILFPGVSYVVVKSCSVIHASSSSPFSYAIHSHAAQFIQEERPCAQKESPPHRRSAVTPFPLSFLPFQRYASMNTAYAITSDIPQYRHSSHSLSWRQLHEHRVRDSAAHLPQHPHSSNAASSSFAVPDSSSDRASHPTIRNCFRKAARADQTDRKARG